MLSAMQYTARKQCQITLLPQEQGTEGSAVTSQDEVCQLDAGIFLISVFVLSLLLLMLLSRSGRQASKQVYDVRLKQVDMNSWRPRQKIWLYSRTQAAT
jgi:hypothetical protein